MISSRTKFDVELMAIAVALAVLEVALAILETMTAGLASFFESAIEAMVFAYYAYLIDQVLHRAQQ